MYLLFSHRRTQTRLRTRLRPGKLFYSADPSSQGYSAASPVRIKTVIASRNFSYPKGIQPFPGRVRPGKRICLCKSVWACRVEASCEAWSVANKKNSLPVVAKRTCPPVLWRRSRISGPCSSSRWYRFLEDRQL